MALLSSAQTDDAHDATTIPKTIPILTACPAETSINQLFTILVVLLFTFEKRDSLGCVSFVTLTRITGSFFVCSLQLIMTNHDER